MCCENWKHTLEVLWRKTVSCHLALLRIERGYSNRWVWIKKRSFRVLFLTNVYLIWVLWKKWILVWILRFPKLILAFASNKKFFVSTVNCCVSALLMTFKSFVLVSPQPQYSKIENEISIWFIYSFVSSLIFDLYIFLFCCPRHQHFTLHKI